MECPVCPSHPPLLPEVLEPGIASHGCAECGGHWMRLASYWKWRARSGPDLPELPPRPDDAVPLQDSRGIKRCPDCGSVLATYRIGHGIFFTIDRCPGCEGTWLDRHEWETLRGRNLHDDLHRVFSDQWQSDLRREEQRWLTERQFQRLFGGEDYARLREIRGWLDAHPRRSELYAYLRLQEKRRDEA